MLPHLTGAYNLNTQDWGDGSVVQSSILSTHMSQHPHGSPQPSVGANAFWSAGCSISLHRLNKSKKQSNLNTLLHSHNCPVKSGYLHDPYFIDWETGSEVE